MKIIKVDSANKDFENLCKKLEEYQFELLPILKEKNYSLVQNLQEIFPFVMYEENLAIGCIGVKRISNESCEVVRVFVDKKYRGKGYALKLFDAAENFAKSLGYKKAELVVWSAAKPAVALYKKLGYTFEKENISEWYGGHKYFECFKKL